MLHGGAYATLSQRAKKCFGRSKSSHREKFVTVLARCSPWAFAVHSHASQHCRYDFAGICNVVAVALSIAFFNCLRLIVVVQCCHASKWLAREEISAIKKHTNKPERTANMRRQHCRSTMNTQQRGCMRLVICAEYTASGDFSSGYINRGVQLSWISTYNENDCNSHNLPCRLRFCCQI